MRKRMKKMSIHSVNSAIVEAVRQAYHRGEEDEALNPIVTTDREGRPVGRLRNGEYVIFYDIRGEREIEITQSLTERGFAHFPVKQNTILNFVTMIEYHSSLPVRVAFPPEGEIKNTLGEKLSKAGLSVLKIAESEKVIHISYFMNGKNENPFPGEKRIVVPSPEGMESYADVPEMSARQVGDSIIRNLADSSHSFIMANLANVDVVGHIENKAAVIKAVEAVDRELGRIVKCCAENKVTLVVTADHGTVEDWYYPDGTVNTGHTKSPVPFITADFSQINPQNLSLKDKGELSDVAPTLLELMDLKQGEEMTGDSLVVQGKPVGDSDRRILLLILDGWGMNTKSPGNLILEAQTPNFDKLWAGFPHSLLEASGEAVGMPEGTVGNSEAGHLHIGSGRRILLDRVKIDRAVEDRSFFKNKAFLWAMGQAKKENKPLHLLGIVSHYSSHGTIRHLFALLEMAKEQGLAEVYIHALIGRRGERPESGAIYVEKVAQKCSELCLGEIVTVMGRYWALDREENWDLVEKAYRSLVFGEGTPASPTAE
jgi:2,3-bisphosphoglycerate-independent phosphoglycerate mutase